MDKKITLKRSLSLPLLVLYGLGTTIGAGIYALAGEIAAVAGYLAPLSFLFASLMAGFTAMSFAELSGRLPRAAGAALYVREGFHSAHLSTLIGMLVILAGLVSAAALVNGFTGYLHQFTEFDRLYAIVAVTLVLGGIAVWGISESVTIAATITVVEIGGLLLVIFVSREGLAELPARWPDLVPSFDSMSWKAALGGAILSFYAFIGFEDLVNVAEEAKDARHNLPAAVLLTLGFTTLLYLVLMVAAVLAMPPSELAASEAPLAYLYESCTGKPATVVSAIGMFAIINGALIQMVMAARVLYGLGSQGQLPRILSRVHPRTRTPVLATLLVTGIVLALGLIGRLASLAELTSVIMLTVFSFVNLALCRIKLREPEPQGLLVFPLWIPVTGFLVSFAFVAREIIDLLRSTGFS